MTKKKGDKPSELDLRDERILAEIIAWAEGHPNTVRPRTGQWLQLRDGQVDPDGPCCAVGAGLLYRGIDAREYLASSSGTEIFARKYGVSEAFAQGVDNGFEDRTLFGSNRTDDYARGLSVGIAAREWAESMGRR